MIDKEHLKTRLRKFLEEKDLGTAAGLCVYLVRGLEPYEGEYATWKFLRGWFEPHREPRSMYVDRLYSASPKRLALAQKLLEELESETITTEDISDGTPDNPDIH